MESTLLALPGPDASIAKYVEQSKDKESDPDAFYDGGFILKKHSWDACRVRDEEFMLVCWLQIVF